MSKADADNRGGVQTITPMTGAEIRQLYADGYGGMLAAYDPKWLTMRVVFEDEEVGDLYIEGPGIRGDAADIERDCRVLPDDETLYLVWMPARGERLIRR